MSRAYATAASSDLKGWSLCFLQSLDHPGSITALPILDWGVDAAAPRKYPDKLLEKAVRLVYDVRHEIAEPQGRSDVGGWAAQSQLRALPKLGIKSTSMMATGMTTDEWTESTTPNARFVSYGGEYDAACGGGLSAQRRYHHRGGHHDRCYYPCAKRLPSTGRRASRQEPAIHLR